MVVPGQVSINMFFFECPIILFSLDLLLIFLGGDCLDVY